MTERIESRDKFLALLVSTGKSVITKQEIRDLCEANDMKVPQWFTKDDVNRAGRGMFRVPGVPVSITADNHVSTQEEKEEEIVEQVAMQPLALAPVTKKLKIATIATDLEEQGIIPLKYKNYVPFGNFDDLKAIILSRQFYPVFITGPSGNGKSLSVEQVCAMLGREYVCVSMTPETDEGDLLGNYILLDNQMIWRDGAVTTAARRGAVLCIDEIDYGAQNLSCLQRVLEGKPFLLKKKGELVTPAPGFQIIATANTKGKGSEDGRYMFTNVLNESFLERFPITFEQEWAPNNVERRIIKKELETSGREDDDFAMNLVTWASTIRKAYEEEGASSEVVSTRRLVHIARAYPIFNGDRIKAITYCLNRFDEETKKSFIDLYTKVDASVTVNNTVNSTDPSAIPDPDAATIVVT
jgi:MoxR-like ATPase